MNYLVNKIYKGYILRTAIGYEPNSVVKKLLGATTNVVRNKASNQIFFKMRCERYIK